MEYLQSRIYISLAYRSHQNASLVLTIFYALLQLGHHAQVSPINEASLRSIDTATLQVRGFNPFTCFGCGWAFQCNPFQCPGGSGTLPHSTPHTGTFTYDAGTNQRAVRRIDDNVTVYIDPQADGSIIFHLRLSALFSLHVSDMAAALVLNGGPPQRGRLSNPEPYKNLDITVPGSEINAAVLRNANSAGVITVNLSYELEREL